MNDDVAWPFATWEEALFVTRYMVQCTSQDLFPWLGHSCKGRSAGKREGAPMVAQVNDLQRYTISNPKSLYRFF